MFAIAALVVPAAASAQVNGGVGFRVAQEPGSTMEGGFIAITAGAGQSATGFFLMTNTGSAAAQMRIYPADGLTGSTTGVVFGDAGATPAEAGSWIRPSIRSASLQGRSEQRIDFTVTVPSSAQSGDHVGSIVLEQNGRASATVSQVVRNVVPIRVVVPGGTGPQIRIRSATIDALPGTTLPAVIVALRNTGDRMCAPVLTVGMRGPSESGSQVSRQLDMILPGDRAPYPLPWPREVEPGSYITSVTTSGCGSADTATVTLEAPDLSTTAAAVGDPNPKNDKTQKLVTDASPTDTIYVPGPGAKKQAAAIDRDRSGTSDDTSSGSAAVPPAGTGGGAGTAAPAKPTGGSSADRGWLDKAIDAVAENAPAVMQRATIPLLLLLMVGLVFFVQEAIDRRDPKLALAPLHREPHLPFTPESFALPRSRVVPSPTALRTDP